MIISIVAAGNNNVIGKDNQLLWHLPDDFKRFKSITTGHYIIMGRKTFESFPKPLPNRIHVIITRDENYTPIDTKNCIVVNNIEKAIDICPDNEDIFIIGGGEIYKQSMNLVDRIELTRVNCDIDGDTYFPSIDKNEWNVIKREYHNKDDKHQYDFEYLTYQKKKD